MEKYSRFRDEATGIAPFQDVPPVKFNVFQSAAIFVLGIFSTAGSIITLFLYFALVRWLFPVFISRFFLNYWILFPLRVMYSTFAYEGERRASIRKDSIRKAQPGDILLVNFVSPLDPLIFESHHKSHFALPTSDGKYESVTTLGAMQRALASTSATPNGVALSQLSSAAGKAGAILVVFVEGTTTNGRGLLTLKALGIRDIATVESQVYAAAIRYTPASAVAPTPSTLFGYIWYLSRAALWFMVSVRVCKEPLIKGALTKDQISKSISAQGHLRILGDKLDVSSKQEYLDLKRNKRSK